MIKQMPRSSGVLVGRTFGQLQTIVVPEIKKAWEKLGYYEGVHYVVGRKPPKGLRFENPLTKPLKQEYYIHWYNGSGIHLVSQDREGSGRGFNIDWVMADEGLTLIEDRFRKEVLAANRGNEDQGWKTKLLHSITISSSKPTGSSGNWLLDMGNYYLEDGNDYELLNKQIADLLIEYIIGLADERPAKELLQLYARIVELRSRVKYYTCKSGPLKGVFYNEATSIDNVEHTGLNYLVRQYRDLDRLEFLVEIINLTLKEVPNGFYHALSEKLHCYYDTYNYSYLDQVGWDQEKALEKDCRQDGDLNPNQPLDIACDYGYYLNCMVVGQEHNTSHKEFYKFLNSFWKKPPEMIGDVVEQFCQYYRFHQDKRVRYFYDQTAMDKAGKKFSYKEQVMQVLAKHNWTVEEVYLGAVPGHNARYELWGRALRGDDRLPMPIFSMPRCKYLVLSMQLAGVVQGKHGFEKDKRPEKNELLPQEETPHQSDAADILYYGRFIDRLVGGGVFVDTVMK